MPLPIRSDHVVQGWPKDKQKPHLLRLLENLCHGVDFFLLSDGTKADVVGGGPSVLAKWRP